MTRHTTSKTFKSALKAPHLDVHLTHPDKILYPELAITKLAIAEYYNEMSDWIMPYIAKRPLTLIRCPNGWNEKCFFQKHLFKSMDSAFYSIDIEEKHEIQPYLYIKDKAGLMALVQLSVLEIHPWGCHVDNIEKPDLIIFDLDPAPDVEWKQVIKAAFFIKKHLEENNLQSFVKTTGGKGLHVVIPLKRQYGWEEVEIFTHTFVNYLVALEPDNYIANMSKARRNGKIFIDYLRNKRGATAIAPYSTRANKNATVAVPLAWNELTAKMKSDTFTMENILHRLKRLDHDPWEGFFDIKQKLNLPKI